MPAAVIVIPVVLPAIKSVTMFALVCMLPDAVTLDNVPKLVTLGCEAVVSVPATKFAVSKLPALTLPAVALPVTANELNVPTLVIFGCAAVVNVPATVVNTPAAAPILPTLALPVTLNAPAVVKLPPVTLPVATTNPPVPKLPTLALPVAFSVPDIFAPVPVTTTMFALPAELIVTLALASTLTLLLPFCIAVASIPVN